MPRFSEYFIIIREVEVLVSIFYSIIARVNIFAFLCSVRTIFPVNYHLFWYREEGSVTILFKKHSADEF